MTTITEVNFDKTKTAGTSGQQLSSNNRINFSSHGVITSVKDGVATCSGLRGISFNEMVIIKDNIYGLCMNLETDTVGIIILGNDRLVGMGDSVRRAFKVVTINAEHAFLGRVVDPLSNPVDGYPLSYEPNFLPWDQKQLELELTSNEISEKDEDITNKDIVSYFFGDNATSRKKNFFYPIDTKAPGIVDRESISESLFTGIKIIDSMIPVGRGQRELIIGDRQTGKSAIAVDTVINQRISQNSNF
jgi:F0F1-type ATP synthase alpha subunit